MVGLGHMKNIDIKSLIIGVLLTSTIFLGVAATSPTDKWDNEQKWDVTRIKSYVKITAGWEPIGSEEGKILVRKRIK